MVLGSDIYRAAIAGARASYNRSTDDYSVYSRKLKACYENCLSAVEDGHVKQRILENTCGDWRGAYLPLSLALFHTHRFGEPCEPHARVYLTSDPTSLFDIPMEYWDRFLAEDSGEWMNGLSQEEIDCV